MTTPNIIPLSRATICVECCCVTDSKGDICVSCKANGSLLPISRILSPTPELGPHHFHLCRCGVGFVKEKQVKAWEVLQNGRVVCSYRMGLTEQQAANKVENENRQTSFMVNPAITIWNLSSLSVCEG